MRSFDYNKFAYKTWDTDILNLIAKIHECKGRQDLYIRQKPIELDRLVEIARVQSTEASNRIEGIVTTSSRMKQLFKEKTMPRNRDEDEIMGYRDVLNTIHGSYEYIPIRSSNIQQLHRDLLKRSGSSFGGNFKNVQNYISETREDGSTVTRLVPVGPSDTPQAVDDLCNAYESAIGNEKVDALILIPAFISDFLCIHPFNDANGRMSRLLTLLLLYQNGYKVGKYISIEKQIEKTKDRYYDALEESDQGWHENTNDSTPFIRYMLQVILACYTEFEERVGMMSETGERNTSYDIVKRYVERKIGMFTGAEAVASCPSLGRSSVLSALKKLTAEGYIIRKGSGRNSYYVRSDDGKNSRELL
ncbi:MAG: Fic family protein [Erysipelotrichaceae bacterium]|nr:Fic family protein [Erysipelotrichaceae bacterium]